MKSNCNGCIHQPLKEPYPSMYPCNACTRAYTHDYYEDSTGKTAPHRGKWIEKEGEKPECSECGRKAVYQIIDGRYAYENFCPHCGVEMEVSELPK